MVKNINDKWPSIYKKIKNNYKPKIDLLDMKLDPENGNVMLFQILIGGKYGLMIYDDNDNEILDGPAEYEDFGISNQEVEQKYGFKHTMKENTIMILKKIIKEEIRKILNENSEIEAQIKKVRAGDIIRIKNKAVSNWHTIKILKIKLNSKNNRFYVDITDTNKKDYMFYLDEIDLELINVGKINKQQEKKRLKKYYEESLADYMSNYDEETMGGVTADYAFDLYRDKDIRTYLEMTVNQWSNGNPSKNDYIQKIQWDLESFIK